MVLRVLSLRPVGDGPLVLEFRSCQNPFRITCAVGFFLPSRPIVTMCQFCRFWGRVNGPCGHSANQVYSLLHHISKIVSIWPFVPIYLMLAIVMISQLFPLSPLFLFLKFIKGVLVSIFYYFAKSGNHSPVKKIDFEIAKPLKKKVL